MDLKDLEVYQLACGVSAKSWKIYTVFDYKTKSIIGDQFIRSVDSVGANIAEGFGRFHYLDRNKFNYNARGSLIEAMHWLETLKDRGFVKDPAYSQLYLEMQNLGVKLNNFISSTKKLGTK